MANTSPYAGLYYCEHCHKTKPEKDFYGSNNLVKYPNNGKLTQCKQCISMHIDNWNPDTYMWILEECDVPYIPTEWVGLLQKYAKDPAKVTGSTILGRYLAKMKLKQYRDYRWNDTEFLQELANQKIEATMKQTGQYSAAEIAMAIEESNKIVMPEKPPELLAQQVPVQSYNPFEQEDEEDLSNGLTPEDITYLKIKWGKTYKPDEWLQLEKLYVDMMESYDIQTAGHIDTLKFICKTSLKANQLLDLGDVDGAQKMLKMYDSMMKSGKFTEAQNKAEKGEAIDSISELVAICEKEGFIPRFYTEGPQDKVDRVLQDLQTYTKTLVVEEMGLGAMIEKAAKQMQEDQQRKESNDGAEDDEQAMEDELFAENADSDIDPYDMYDLLEQEDEYAEADWAAVSGEVGK
ncbi:MAG: hypothetical protein J6R32_06810 [Bacteroidales bacterium]|nr:hypothetical protein [Bacteroidales bacterium]